MPVENFVAIDIQELIKIIANSSNQFKKNSHTRNIQGIEYI